MADNLMNPEHKATNKKYRDGYDKIFGKRELKGDTDDTLHRDDDYYAGFLVSSNSCSFNCSECSSNCS